MFGFLADLILQRFFHPKKEKPFEELCANCDCDHHSLLHSALHHTISIFLFILVVNLVLGYAIYFIGEDRISGLLLNGQRLSTVPDGAHWTHSELCGIRDLNGAVHAGSLQFGSCVAGLCAGAGVGLVVLFRTNHRVKENLAIVGTLYACSVVTGMLVNLIF